MSECEGNVIDKAVWHYIYGYPYRTCGLELTFQNGATVLLGRTGETTQISYTQGPVKKITYDKQVTTYTGKGRFITYYGEDRKYG